MKIHIMRRIDRWLGVPICFLLSCINSILNAMSHKKISTDATPKKFLFVKPSEMGAIILSYPLISRIKKTYPDADLFFLTFEAQKGVFSLLNEIIPENNVLSIREDSIFKLIIDCFKVIIRLRKEKIDVAFDLEFFSRLTVILCFLSNTKRRIGFYRYAFEGHYRGNLLTHRVQYNPLSHVSKTYLSLSQVVPDDQKVSPEFQEKLNEDDIIAAQFISKADCRSRIEKKLAEFGISKKNRLILVNPGEGTLAFREWPLDNFIAVAKKILTDKRNYIIIAGTENVSRKAEILCEAVKSEHCVNFGGQTSLPELMELFDIADVLLTNDCGLAHLASLTPVHKFIMFGPESPQLFAPLGVNNHIIFTGFPCSPCLSAFNHRETTCQDNKCLQAINVDYVHHLVTDCLTQILH